MKLKTLLITIIAFFCSYTMQAQNKKSLVAYFSATGTTRIVADQLAEVSNSDIFEIVPVQPYTAADLNWRDENSRSSIEMKDKSSRPKITKKLTHIEQYDTIYVGFPIWWYIAPTIINTFLEDYDLSGKTIILFATSGGSQWGETVKYLKGSVSSTTNIVEGRVLNNVTKEDIANWVKSIKK